MLSHVMQTGVACQFLICIFFLLKCILVTLQSGAVSRVVVMLGLSFVIIVHTIVFGCLAMMEAFKVCYSRMSHHISSIFLMGLFDGALTS